MDCLVIFMSEKELSIVINGNDIEINGFVTGFVKETIIGMLSSLKLEENEREFKTIEIKINNE